MRLPTHPLQLRDERVALERLLARGPLSEPSAVSRPTTAPPARSRPWLANSSTRSTVKLRPAPSVVTLEEYIGSPAALSQARELYESCAAARVDDSRNQAALRAQAGGGDGPRGHYEVRDSPRATRTPIFGTPPVRPRGTRADPMQGVKGQYGHLVYDVKVYTNPKSQCLEPLEGNPRCIPIFSNVPARVGTRGDVRYTGKETEVFASSHVPTLHHLVTALRLILERRLHPGARPVRTRHVQRARQREGSCRPLHRPFTGAWIQLIRPAHLLHFLSVEERAQDTIS